MKKLTSILLAIVILSLTLSFSSCEMTSEEDLKFFPQPSGIYVTGCTSDLMYMIIPETYEGEKVVGITLSAFRGSVSLKKVIISDSVTEIGNFAFADCTSLKKVKIPDSVTEIGIGAFSGCISLRKIVFEGTKREWASMSKSSNYTDIPEDAVVVCSDGSLYLVDNTPV